MEAALPEAAFLLARGVTDKGIRIKQENVARVP